MKVAAVQAGDGLMIDPATCMLLRMSRIIDMRRSSNDRAMMKICIPLRSLIQEPNKFLSAKAQNGTNEHQITISIVLAFIDLSYHIIACMP
jgi:hypothetical protein